MSLASLAPSFGKRDGMGLVGEGGVLLAALEIPAMDVRGVLRTSNLMEE